MRKKIKMYTHTIMCDCKFTDDTNDIKICEKVILRLKDISDNVNKGILKKVVKSYVQTLKIRLNDVDTISQYRFYLEVIKNLERIIKKD